MFFPPITVDVLGLTMPDFDRDLEKKTYSDMRARAIARWGEDRVPWIEETLTKAAAAVASMDAQNFDVSDSPGFMLAEFAWIDDEMDPEDADAE